jgi:predicted AAA+ superfamily ATPase
MLLNYRIHNYFQESLDAFVDKDPHLNALSHRAYHYYFNWWKLLNVNPQQNFEPGIYILTGGRQVGKSTSCKQLMLYVLQNHYFSLQNLLYLPCDEIYEVNQLSQTIRLFLEQTNEAPFLLIIDEVTFVKHWERTIKALADEGYFKRGICLLTGSDSFMLKEAAMSFPGRRGMASQVDFHLYPLSFHEYVELRLSQDKEKNELRSYFNDYLLCGGYLPAMNDLAEYKEIKPATYLTYEQWIRGDFLKSRKNEETLLHVLLALVTVGVSQISYTKLTQKIGLINKDTCIDYCRLLERMDVIFTLPALDLNKLQGAPRKEQKIHFKDPFIYRAIVRWLQVEGYPGLSILEQNLVEACIASHCQRLWKTFYFKGQGEIDVMYLKNQTPHALEVKWASQIRPNDLKMLHHFSHRLLLTKNLVAGKMQDIDTLPADQFLYQLSHQ